MRFPRVLVVGVSLAALVVSCSKTDPQDPNFVVAKGDGVEVTRAELNRTMDQFLKSQGVSREMYPKEKLQNIESQTARQLVLEELLMDEAAKLQIDEAAINKETETKIKEYVDMGPSRNFFLEQLKRVGMTEEEFEADVRKQVIVEKVIEASVPEPPAPSQDEIEAFYKQHESTAFQRPHDEVRASHVLVKVNPGDDAKAKAQKKQKIEAARKRVADGEDFTVVAKEISEDRGSASVGGDLGYFKRGEMVPEFETVAFAADMGKISEVFESPFGYHFLKVTDKRSKGKIPLAEAQGQIMPYLRDSKRMADLRRHLAEMEKAAKVEYFISMPKEPPPPPGVTGPGGVQPPMPPDEPSPSDGGVEAETKAAPPGSAGS